MSKEKQQIEKFIVVSFQVSTMFFDEKRSLSVSYYFEIFTSIQEIEKKILNNTEKNIKFL